MDDSIFKSNFKVFLNKVIVHGTTKYHAHNFIEIAYIDSGTGFHRMEEKQAECHEGDYFIINYDVPHEFVCRDELVVCNCIFAPEFIDFSMLGCRDFNKMTSNYLLGNIPPLSGLHLSDIAFRSGANTKQIFTSMYQEYTQKRTGYIELIRALLIELLIDTLRQAEEKLPFTYNKSNNLSDVLSYIQETIHIQVPLEELAMMAFLSPAYFSRQFKQQMGETVTGFRQRLRISEAKRQLACTAKSVIEISESIGYHDLKYFTKLFVQYEGCTPTQYRKKLVQP